MIGCSPSSFSSEAASVEKPVLVFFCGVRPRLSNSIVRSCGVELTLNSSPAAAQMSSVSDAHSAIIWSLSARSALDVDADADVLHVGQHPHERDLDVVVRGCAGPGCRARPSSGSAR